MCLNFLLPIEPQDFHSVTICLAIIWKNKVNLDNSKNHFLKSKLI